MNGGCQCMNKSQYNAPFMEVVELGDKDIVCASMGWEVTGPGGVVGGGSVKPERSNTFVATSSLSNDEHGGFRIFPKSAVFVACPAARAGEAFRRWT